MDTFILGVPWIHVIPALVSVLFSVLYLKSNKKTLKIIFGILWLLFLPNTAYIFTDVSRITLHWNSLNTLLRVFLSLQFIVLEIIGLGTFLLSFLPFEKIIKNRSKLEKIFLIILFNFLVGFGMVLGRTGYVNSYLIFMEPLKVLSAIFNIITSFNLLVLTIFYGLICDVVYFVFRSYLFKKQLKIGKGGD